MENTKTHVNLDKQKGMVKMIFEITNSSGEKFRVQPRIGLYSVTHFMGVEMPGLAIILDEVDSTDMPRNPLPSDPG